MLGKPLGLILLLGTAGTCSGSTFGVEGLSFKAGVGYEFLSQDFYVDSLNQAGADTLDITTTLRTTYLDDIKGQLRVGYAPPSKPGLRLDGICEQTPDQSRLRGYLNHAFDAGPFRLDWNAEADWRTGRVDPEMGDPGYMSSNGRFRASLPISSKTKVWSRIRGDLVRFDSAGAGAYDYTRTGGELGLTQRLGSYSEVSLSGLVLRRFVPDASSEAYHSSGLNLSFIGTVGGGDVDLVTLYESRNYDRPAGLDDYRRWNLILRDQRPLSGTVFAREELEFEFLWFDTTSYLVTRYQRIESAVLVGMERSWGSVAAGPHLALLSEKKVDAYTVGEDYVEYGIKTQLDIIRPGNSMASLESITGRREPGDNSSTELVQTDFTFERLNLLVDWLLAGRIGLNVLLSTEWEWHRDVHENSRLVLMTSSLTYSF